MAVQVDHLGLPGPLAVCVVLTRCATHPAIAYPSPHRSLGVAGSGEGRECLWHFVATGDRQRRNRGRLELTTAVGRARAALARRASAQQALRQEARSTGRRRRRQPPSLRSFAGDNQKRSGPREAEG